MLQSFQNKGSGCRKMGFYPNKKQTLEVPGSNSFAGISASSLSPWGSVSGFNSVPSQFTEQLFNTDATRSTDFDERNISSVSMGGLDMEERNQFWWDQEGKVSEVRDPETSWLCRQDLPILENLMVEFQQLMVMARWGDSGISMGLTYGREHSAITNSISGADCNIMPMVENFSKGDNNVISEGTSARDNMISVSHTYKGDSSIPVTSNYNRVDGSPTVISSAKQQMRKPCIIHGSFIQQGGQADTLNQKNVTVSNANAAIVAAAQAVASGAESAFRKKEDSSQQEDTSQQIFLQMLEVCFPLKELRGIIKGSGYLCGCLSCNFSKVINAYEFERHAGRQNKTPNNHIYFENGKTIYGIVQELRNTPQNMLIFLAATRELQRIYGKDERNQS
ncbi:Diaminobutyrate--2-oxoglutarate transaminase [Bienertia sinuspersici]